MRLQGVYGSPAKSFYRTLLLRCFPIDWLPPSPGSAAPTDPAALRALSQWQDALRAQSICVQATDFTQPVYQIAGVGWFGVTGSDCLGTPLNPEDESLTANYVLLSLTTDGLIPSTDPTTGAPSEVGIHGVRWSGTGSRRTPKLNGTRQVVNTAPGFLVVQAQLPTTGQYVQGGRVQLSTHAYVPIREVVPRGWGRRSAGTKRHPHRQRLAPLLPGRLRISAS